MLPASCSQGRPVLRSAWLLAGVWLLMCAAAAGEATRLSAFATTEGNDGDAFPPRPTVRGGPLKETTPGHKKGNIDPQAAGGGEEIFVLQHHDSDEASVLDNEENNNYNKEDEETNRIFGGWGAETNDEITSRLPQTQQADSKEEEQNFSPGMVMGWAAAAESDAARDAASPSNEKPEVHHNHSSKSSSLSQERLLPSIRAKGVEELEAGDRRYEKGKIDPQVAAGAPSDDKEAHFRSSSSSSSSSINDKGPPPQTTGVDFAAAGVSRRLSNDSGGECQDLEISQLPVEFAPLAELGGCGLVGQVTISAGVHCNVDLATNPSVQGLAPGLSGFLKDFCCASCAVCGGDCFGTHAPTSSPTSPTGSPTHSPTVPGHLDFTINTLEQLKDAVAQNTMERITIEVTTDLTWDEQITVKEGQHLVIRGNNTAEGKVVMDAQQNNRHFDVEEGARLTIFGITLKNGYSTYGGGAVYNLGTFNADTCSFDGNSADGYSMGGGAVWNSGTLTADSCSFDGNEAYNDIGGAVYNDGTFTADSCRFDGNSAQHGGAVYNSGTLTADSCSFNGNSAGHGGAVFNSGTLTADSCSFNGNEAGGGGAVSNSGTLTADSCSFDGNEADFGDGYDAGNAIRTSSIAIPFLKSSLFSEGQDVYIDARSSVQFYNTTLPSLTGQGQLEGCELGQAFLGGAEWRPGDQVCEACPRSEYMDEPTMDDQNIWGTCKPCPAGRQGKSTETKSEWACIPCEVGTELSNSTCVPCEAGKARSTFDQAACVSCNATKGEYSDPGASSCSVCEPGTELVDGACVKCEPGKSRSFDQDKCSPCKDGYFAQVNGTQYCERCSSLDFLRTVEDASACVCALSFVPEINNVTTANNGTTRCTCGPGEFLSPSADACTPCPSGFVKPGLGLEKALCVYGATSTWPAVVGLGGGLVLAMGFASFRLRNHHGGLLGALHALFAGGFAASLLRTSVEILDIGTDSVALNDVLRNPALASFHVTYAIVCTCGALVSLYALVKRGLEVRRKWRRAASAVAAADSDARGAKENTASSTARQVLMDGITEAFAFATGLELATAIDALRADLEDSVAIKVAERERRELEEAEEELAEAVMEK